MSKRGIADDEESNPCCRDRSYLTILTVTFRYTPAACVSIGQRTSEKKIEKKELSVVAVSSILLRHVSASAKVHQQDHIIYLHK